jgi:A/G-specific adenine glycosylase
MSPKQISPEKTEEFRSKTLEWAKDNLRKFPWRNPDSTQYEKIVSETLLQRTRAETVAKYFPAFIAKYPSWEAIRKVELVHLVSDLSPNGLANQKAPRLKALANYLGYLGDTFPGTREELEPIPTLGQYIQNAVLLLIHDQPEPLLDVNMARVLERYFGKRKKADIRDDEYLQKLAHRVVNCSNPTILNWAILDLGALVCKPKNPACIICPLRLTCKIAKE